MTSVLIVEDEPLVADEHETMLLDMGYKVVGKCKTATEAIDKSLQMMPDLILMDINLDIGTSGIEAAKKILKNQSIPIIFVTGFLDADTLKQVKTIQPYGYLQKPVQRDLLFSSIEMALYKANFDFQLRENEKRIMKIKNSLLTAVVVIDAKTKSFVEANIAATKIIGHSEKELIGKKCSDYFCSIQHDCDCQFTLINQAKENIEEVIVNAKGEAITILKNISPFDFGDKKLISVSFIDITERKRSEEMYRVLFENSHDAIMILDPETQHYVSCNPATVKMFKVKNEDEFLLLHPWDFSPEFQNNNILSKDKAASYIQQTIDTGAMEFEWTHRRKTGEDFPAIVQLNRIVLNKRTLVQASVRDVSEQKRIELELNHSRKLEAVGQLAAGIAHEINTPTQYVGDNIHFMKDSLNSILLQFVKYRECLKSILNKTHDQNHIKSLLNEIDEDDIEFLLEEIPMAIDQSHEGIERISNIVKAMKEFSHPGTKEKQYININKAIETTITVARNEWKYISDIEKDFDSSLPLVPCIVDEFNQVILNLVINAVHAISEKLSDNTTEKGKITVSTLKNAQFVEIHITDTGAGIPESVQDKIFNPFFTTKEIGKGTGQGLAICYNVIVDKHNGSINFETKENEGTTFIVKLPINEKVG